MYCLDMLAMAMELAHDDPAYEDVASKFFEHFVYISKAMNNMGGKGIGLWDERGTAFTTTSLTWKASTSHESAVHGGADSLFAAAKPSNPKTSPTCRLQPPHAVVSRSSS